MIQPDAVISFKMSETFLASGRVWGWLYLKGCPVLALGLRCDIFHSWCLVPVPSHNICLGPPIFLSCSLGRNADSNCEVAQRRERLSAGSPAGCLEVKSSALVLAAFKLAVIEWEVGTAHVNSVAVLGKLRVSVFENSYQEKTVAWGDSHMLGLEYWLPAFAGTVPVKLLLAFFLS